MYLISSREMLKRAQLGGYAVPHSIFITSKPYKLWWKPLPKWAPRHFGWYARNLRLRGYRLFDQHLQRSGAQTLDSARAASGSP